MKRRSIMLAVKCQNKCHLHAWSLLACPISKSLRFRSVLNFQVATKILFYQNSIANQWRIQYFGRGGRQEEIGKKLFLVDNVVAPKALRCVARKATLTRGVRGHAPPENFHNFNAKWWTMSLRRRRYDAWPERPR